MQLSDSVDTGAEPIGPIAERVAAASIGAITPLFVVVETRGVAELVRDDGQ